VAVPYNNEDPLEVYRYFSTFIKRRDELAGVDDAGEAILQKITYMLEKESGAHVEMLRKLIVNLDVDNCDPSRIDYLGFILGIPIPHDWNDETRRQYLRLLPDLIKIKGTHLNFAKQAAFHDHSDVWLVELWKRIENEDRSYREVPNPSHQLKSARVDMLSCATSCESICESICEGGFQVDGDYVPPGTAERILAELGEVLPIHVVLRRQQLMVEPNEAFYPSFDTLGCHTSCESICEDACESDTQVWPGSYTESDFRDLGPIPQDRWAYETICITLCESICQTCCECGQEGTCATVCEVTCQVVCATVCQSTCMASCQTVCQIGACQVTCAATCQLSCQSICITTCETLCEADLE
jgi:hypothetical protein